MAAISIHLRNLRINPKRKRVNAESILSDELDREAMSTERLRLLVLIIVIASGLLLYLIPPDLLSGDIARDFHGHYQSFFHWRLCVLLALITYLIVERVLLGRRITRGRKVSPFYRYLSALVETSSPTVEIMLVAHYTNSVAALSSIPVFIYSLFIVVSALRLNFNLSVFTGAVAAIEYTLVGIIYLGHDSSQFSNPILVNLTVHAAKGMVLLLLGVVTGLVALQIKKRLLDSFKLAEERNDIIRTFGQHLSPAVVDKILEERSGLRIEKRDICVMFLDIRNFSTFAEKRNPEQVVDYLDSLFEFMIEIVNRHQGIINKFLGDGFMAIFGAPLSEGRDCTNAVEAAREILRQVETEVARGAILPTRVGIGLHAGEAVTGSIGSTVRKEYTVIGDVVNLASRIEQLNKQFDSQLLISEVVWEAARKDGLTGALPMGRVLVKGREEPIAIYRVA